MTTAVQSRETSEKVDLWLRMCRQMLAIRRFETQVNELYTRALMRLNRASTLGQA